MGKSTAGRADAESSERLRGIIELQIQLLEMRRSIAGSTRNLGDATVKMKTEDALAGDWRRTNEEPNLALADDDNRLGLRRRSSNLHQNNGDSKDRSGHHRVHDNAELAVVGVGGVGMKVRDLGEGQGGKQNQTQTRDDRQKYRPAAMLSTEKCPNCLQKPTSMLLFYKRT
jgi:hypothetical protein